MIHKIESYIFLKSVVGYKFGWGNGMGEVGLMIDYEWFPSRYGGNWRILREI